MSVLLISKTAGKSKYNTKRENQVILLMITDGKKWHHLAVKTLQAFFRGVTSNNNGKFYCLNCFHSFRTKNELEKHEKICNDHDYCYVEMPEKDNLMCILILELIGFYCMY